MAEKKKRNNKVAKEKSNKKVKKANKKVEKVVNKADDKKFTRDREKRDIIFAKAKNINMSPRKARLVIDLVRGKKATDAVAELKFVRKRAALPIRKTIESAIANAENNFEMDEDDLYIKEAFVDKAPTYKRGRAGSRGRYKKILKRNCHIIIGLVEKENLLK